ncbi:MAG: hypothetical protein JXB48_13720 [Candidatus Latescibacteria bacterium]|nr:hypothetical protein [Candidatus Latescibacterota bacterium]
MKVIHLPTSVGGNSFGLSRGERELGIQSDVLVLFQNRFQFPADRCIFKKPPGNIISNYTKRIWIPALLKELFSIVKKYDVFHFNFGTSLLDLWMFGLPLLDLPYYRNKGKIVVTYNGCDARMKYDTIERTHFSACHDNRCSTLCNTGMYDKIKRKKISKFDSYADSIFAVNPDILHFLPERARFLPYTVAKWPNIITLPYQSVKKRIKILHAPSHRITKGSSIIIEALEKVKKIYGNKIETILLENLPNDDALKLYDDADLVIDQVLIGFYGAFAVETMKMGKPVMAFIRKEDMHYMPQQMADDCLDTIINVSPDSIYEKLCEIVENPELLKKHREAALDYVHRWHDPVYVAGITKATYEN